MATRYVVGNWKLNGSVDMIAGFADQWPDELPGQDVRVVICAPFPYLAYLAAELPEVELGAQDCSAHASGAFTGEVAAAMLADVGCGWVIVGHSERRQYHGEVDATVAAKAAAAQAVNVTPIVCVGETLAQREANEQVAVVKAQLAGSLAELDITRLVIAYEPVWAIGTGVTATPEQADAMHREIRSALVESYGESGRAVPLLYGGSVKADSAGELFACESIDGALVGGASLEAASFAAIAAAS